MTIDRRLATYGTLAPGEPNHHHLSSLSGTWRRGTVRGVLGRKRSGGDKGLPALTLDFGGPEVSVQLFESDDLPRAWPALDDFEGDGYRRVRVSVMTDEGAVDAWIYVDTDVPELS